MSKITIYAEPAIKVFNDVHYPKPSGSLYNDGLYLADDSADPTSSTLNSSAALVNLDYKTATITGTRGTNESIGVDLGQAKAITSLTLYDDTSAGAGICWSGSKDSCELYGSTDNSAWTLLRKYKPITRTLFSGSVDDTISQIELTLVSGSVRAETYRYFKVYSNEGALVGFDGTSELQYTEIGTKEIVAGQAVSGSIYRKYEFGSPKINGESNIATVVVGGVIVGNNDTPQRSSS